MKIYTLQYNFIVNLCLKNRTITNYDIYFERIDKLLALNL